HYENNPEHVRPTPANSNVPHVLLLLFLLVFQSSDPQGQCLAAPQTPLPTYKQRYDEFKKLFKELPDTERLVVDYPCALQRDILLQGRLYLSEKWLCFYSNVFRGTKISLTLKDIMTVSKEKTARWIPNAIQINMNTEKFFFTSFSAREKSYQTIFRMWQNTLLNKVKHTHTHTSRFVTFALHGKTYLI
uniref:GRAM domain-containing protein n=1 Tax=Cynoglossus semilaevis TaxID=244447 RepID=A0A3P8WMW8_CYNSE